MQIGDRFFDTARHCYVMGILNVTPDSFSDGGKFQQIDKALFHVEEMVEEGADIIDIGGESTRPGYEKISAEEEINRVTPVIKEIKSRFKVPLSLDTYKPQVAKAGILAGADMINDIWGLRYAQSERDKALSCGAELPAAQTMAEVIAKADIPCCLMHNRKEAAYRSFLPEVIGDLEESILLAKRAGIGTDKIIIDPGVGFGKTYEQNLKAIANLESFAALGFPVLLGCSRKSVIGLTLQLPVEERLEGTLATTAIAVLKGCSFVRVHDVKENVRAVRMAEAVIHGQAVRGSDDEAAKP